MSINELFVAIAADGPSPCEKFSCSLVPQCATGMACSAFDYYANHGRAVHPHLVFPAVLTEKQRPRMGDRPMPSREIYRDMNVDSQFVAHTKRQQKPEEPPPPPIPSIWAYVGTLDHMPDLVEE